MTHPQMPVLPCMCASLRRASRALTQRYDQVLRPFRLRATQFTVLQALSLAGEVSQSRLGAILAMDSTTLTRTLHILRRRGWIAERRGRDRRERWVRLSKPGEGLLTRVLPAWEEIQSRFRRRLGEDAWKALLPLLNQVTDLVTTQGDLL